MELEVNSDGYTCIRIGRFEFTATGCQSTFAPFGWVDLFDWDTGKFIFDITPGKQDILPKSF